MCGSVKELCEFFLMLFGFSTEARKILEYTLDLNTSNEGMSEYWVEKTIQNV